jgi:hypothetical protein
VIEEVIVESDGFVIDGIVNVDRVEDEVVVRV